MGSARTAPNPQFEESLKKVTEMPEGKERTMSAMELMLTGGSGGRSIMGRAGSSGGTGMQNAISGIVKPSASATIKAPEPTPDSSMRMFVGGGQESEEAFSKRTGLTKVEPQDSEQTFDDVRTNLLAKAKERRSKISEMKEEAISRMSLPSPTSGLDKFSIENYRAGGADFDRDDTKAVGDDMDTGKPSTQERIKSFLGETMTDPGGWSAVVRTK